MPTVQVIDYPWPYLAQTLPRAARLYSKVARFIRSAVSVLDVACGFAPLKPYLVGASYHGFDCCESVIEILQAKYPKGHWYVSDAHDFAEEIEVDLMLCLGICSESYPHEMTKEAEAYKRLADLYRPTTVVLEIGTGVDRQVIDRTLEYLSASYTTVFSGLYDAELLQMSERRVYVLWRNDQP